MNLTMNLILEALYFIAPAYLANMMPMFFKWLPFGDFPIHEKTFGSHKTYRGIFVGILGGTLGIWIQTMLSSRLISIELLPYGIFEIREILLYGIAFGAGALLGDLAKSFIKRHLKIAPGRPFFPFDQLDLVIGALLLMSPLYVPSLAHILIIVATTPVLHLLANVLAYLLHLKDVWW